MTKNRQWKKYNIEERLSEFLIYYNDRVHSAIKVAQYNCNDEFEGKELLKKLDKII